MKFNVYVLSIYDLIFFANFFAWITLVFIQYKATYTNFDKKMVWN